MSHVCTCSSLLCIFHNRTILILLLFSIQLSCQFPIWDTVFQLSGGCPQSRVSLWVFSRSPGVLCSVMKAQPSFRVLLPQPSGVAFAKWAPGRWRPILHVCHGVCSGAKACLCTPGPAQKAGHTGRGTSTLQNLPQTKGARALYLLHSVSRGF